MMVSKNKKTFTLIEMLIVVVIIGILAAALIPRLQGAQERTRDIARKKDMTDIMNGLVIYYEDNQDYPDSFCNDPNGCRSNRPMQYSIFGTGILGQLVPNYLTKQITDPLKERPYIYNKVIPTDSSYMGNLCGFSGNHNVVELRYYPENKQSTDYFRSCPDGKPFDAYPWNGTHDDSNGRFRGFDLWDGKYAPAIGDAYKK